jgi:hypothetical protein
LVFTTDFDIPVDPRNLLRGVDVAAANAGIVGPSTSKYIGGLA